MPTPSPIRLTRISDDPTQKTVTAFFSDNTSFVLETISGNTNYVNPPGYGAINGSESTFRPLFAQHYLRYTASLSALAVQHGLNIQGLN